MIDCKWDENTRQMMVMSMVIIMMRVIVSNCSDYDGNHSNIAWLSLTDDVDGGDNEQDFISMIQYGIYEQFS